MKTLGSIAVLSALALSCGAHAAAAPVALLAPVAFDPSTDGRMEVREECRLGAQLENRIGDALRRDNKGTGTTTSTDGDVIKVTVTTIWGARGNNWTGPKGLAIRADLLHDGKVQRSTQMHRTSMGGFWGPFKGICAFMDRNAEALGKDLVKWTRDPKYSVPGDAPAEAPAEAPAPGASAPESSK